MGTFREKVIEEKGHFQKAFAQFNSLYEVFGLLTEELQRFLDEIKKKPEERSIELTLEALSHLAAISEQAAEDFRLVKENDVVGQDSYRAKFKELVKLLHEWHAESVISSMSKAVRLQKKGPDESKYMMISCDRSHYDAIINVLSEELCSE